MTAVEWLYDYLFPKQLDGFSDEEWNKIDEAFKQAKEIEKEQIIKAYIASDDIPIDTELYRTLQNNDAKQYYNETYGSKKVDKEEQKKLITEIMDEDAKSGLYNTSLQTELSDEEIGKGRDENIPIDEKDMWSERFYFTIGAKWYREQIKSRQ